MTTKRPVGRPPSGLPKRVRRNLNIERDSGFDSCLLAVRRIMAEQDGCSFEDISQTKAVRYAVYMIANRLPVKLPTEHTCPRCNGVGYVAVHNGDDDETCECCGQVIHADEIPY